MDSPSTSGSSNDSDNNSGWRKASIYVGIWNIAYCLIQFGILGWQVSFVNQLQYNSDDYVVPDFNTIYYQRANYYVLNPENIYEQTPWRRRVNVMLALGWICLILTLFHLMINFGLIYGLVKHVYGWIIPWILTLGSSITLCTVNCILWWTTTIFNDEFLTVSVVEFILVSFMSIPGLIIVILYYYRVIAEDKKQKLLSREAHLRKKPISNPKDRRKFPNDHDRMVPKLQLPRSSRDPRR